MKQLLTPHLFRGLPLAVALLFLSVRMVGAAASYPATVLADNPLAYFRLEELTGAITAADATGDGFDGTYHFSTSNSPQLGQPGITTNSISFNGGGADYGYVDIPNNGGALTPLAGDGVHGAAFSAECWVQPIGFPSSWSVPIESAQYPVGWNFYQSGADAGNGTTSYFYLNMLGTVFAGAADFPITYLRWYHLAVTFDGTNALFYVNGVAHGPYNASGYKPAAFSNVQLASGAGVGWQPFAGGIDEVAFYTNKLTAAQIQNHYQVGTNSFRAQPTAPSILSNPSSTTNFSGLPVTFTVTANGTPPPHFQWYKGTSPIGSDANSVTFTCHYPADNGAGIYVIATNSSGSATSTPATLTVSTDLIIAKTPDSIVRNVGSYAAFRPTAYGAVPITYQWYKGAAQLSGETNATLWLANVQPSDNGTSYSVLVSNPFSSSNLTATLGVQSRAINVPLTGYAQIIAADHPVAYWRLNEPDGSGPAVDAVGSFDGSYLNGAGSFTFQSPTGIPAWTNDPGVAFSGGAYISIPYALELNPDKTWSAETWIQPASLGTDGGDYRVVLSSQYNLFPNPYNGWYVYQQPNGTFAFVPQPGNGFIVAGPNDPAHGNVMVPGQWYHLVVSDDGNRFNVYVNGELRSSFPVSGIAFIPNGDGVNGDGTTGAGATVLGRRTDGAFNTFLGTMDETAFYNYALTPAQVKAHAAGTVSLNITKTGPATVQIAWPVGVLQSATLVTGPYTDITGASSPYSHSTSGPPTFYRVRLAAP
jgi:hypothetical protein